MRFAVLEQFIQEKMAETHLPGLSIALVERGETVYTRGFGFRNSEAGLPATPATLYGIGSVTKSFTALALYGLSIYPGFFGHTLAGHGGSVLISTAHLAFVPDREAGVMVLANGSGYPLAHIAYVALAVMMGEDPWTIPGVRAERALDRLTGRYETYQGTYGATVTRSGDFLLLEIKNKLLAQTLPLVPMDFDAGSPRFFTLSGGRRLVIEFEVHDETIELIYERYKMRRVGGVDA